MFKSMNFSFMRSTIVAELKLADNPIQSTENRNVWNLSTTRSGTTVSCFHWWSWCIDVNIIPITGNFNSVLQDLRYLKARFRITIENKIFISSLIIFIEIALL